MLDVKVDAVWRSLVLRGAVRADIVEALVMSGVSTVENLLLLDAHHICKLSGLEESEVRLVKEKAAEMWACPPERLPLVADVGRSHSERFKTGIHSVDKYGGIYR